MTDQETKEWLDQLDDSIREIQKCVALIAQKQDHQYSTVNRQSDERLALINSRFERLETRFDHHKVEDEQAHNRLLARAGAAFVAFSTAAWFVIVEPAYEDIAVLERRIAHVEANLLASDSGTDD